MQISLMVEGQNGLTWERWSHILALAERLGFPGLYRSDHYFVGQQQDSLETYLSFVMAASETSNIRFGPLVTPITFRAPVNVGRMVAQIDDLSGGRFVCGLGAGWNDTEHTTYGIPFPAVKERFDRLEEAIALIKALWTQSPATYDGRFYQLAGADCLPRPPAGRPPLLIGGSGEKRTLRITAQHADEWNSTMLTPTELAHKNDVLARHCEDFDRDPASIRKSMMIFGMIGPESLRTAAAERLRGMFAPGQDIPVDEFSAGLKARGAIAGGTDEIIDSLGALAEQGIEEVQFQHFFFDSDEIPEYLAAEIAPKAAAL